MKTALMTLALLLTASGCPEETPQKPPAKHCAEDDPCWCATHTPKCPPVTKKPRTPPQPKPRRTVEQA